MTAVKRKKFIVGLDEVGRGSLAGPITVAAVALPRNLRFYGLKDSKKLIPKKRQEWFQYLKTQSDVFYAVAKVTPAVIDRHNVARAANLAASRAFLRLTENYKLKIENLRIFLDGGLYLNLAIPARTLIKGDEKINAIKLASIVAKVKRDKYMTKLHKIYPLYGFAEHKGYGTEKHRRAIKKHGPAAVHRLTFIEGFIKNYKAKP